MKTIKTIFAALLLMAGTAAQAEQELIVKTSTSTDNFQTVSRIVLDLTRENPIVRSKEKSIVYTSDSPIILQFIDKEDAIKLTPAPQRENGAIYDLSGRQIVNGKLSKGKLPKGIYIQNGKKIAVK